MLAEVLINVFLAPEAGNLGRERIGRHSPSLAVCPSGQVGADP